MQVLGSFFFRVSIAVKQQRMGKRHSEREREREWAEGLKQRQRRRPAHSRANSGPRSTRTRSTFEPLFYFIFPLQWN